MNDEDQNFIRQFLDFLCDPPFENKPVRAVFYTMGIIFLATVALLFCATITYLIGV